MKRLALMSGILSLTLAGVAAQALAQTQSGSQQKFYHESRVDAPTGAHQTVPGSTYEATQQRSQNQPGQQPKLYLHQNQPTALTLQPGPSSGVSIASSMGGSNLTRDVQAELSLAGYDPGPIDGVGGPRTTQAIRDFQAANAMPEDGSVSPQLLAELRAEQTSASVVPPSSEAQRSVEFFSGWFQRIDDGSLPQEVQSVAQAQSAPPAPTIAAPPPRPAASPNASDAAAMSRIAPAAGTPAGTPVSGPVTPSADMRGTRLLTEIEKCQTLGLSARADCELAAHQKIAPAADLSRGSVQE